MDPAAASSAADASLGMTAAPGNTDAPDAVAPPERADLPQSATSGTTPVHDRASETTVPSRNMTSSTPPPPPPLPPPQQQQQPAAAPTSPPPQQRKAAASPHASRRAPSVSVLAYRKDLRGAIDNGLPKGGFLHRLKSVRPWKRVLVEGAPLGTKDAVFFAPDNCLSTSEDARGTATAFVNIDPRQSKHTVYRGDAFEISFLGMSVAPHESISTNGNELLLYSLTRHSDPLAPGPDQAGGGFKLGGAPPMGGGGGGMGSMHVHGDAAAGATGDLLSGHLTPEAGKTVGTTDALPSAHVLEPKLGSALLSNLKSTGMSSTNQLMGLTSQLFAVPTGVSSVTGDVPFIHYDPVIDGHDIGSAPDTYVPVPATKSLYLRCLGNRGDAGDEQLPQSVSVRFTIMEIDRVSDLQARSITGVDQLGNYVSSSAETIPYLQLLTRAFAVATSMGKKGLKKYSRPDHVHSIDMEFLLAEREAENAAANNGERAPVCGNYLQYGYYFFLSDKVDAKLYAQTCSSSQSVPLLLKREGFTKRMEARNEKEYFPLTGISYLVAKVTRGCKRIEHDNIPALRQEHKRRLDNMMQMSNTVELLAAMHKNVAGSTNTAHARRT